MSKLALLKNIKWIALIILSSSILNVKGEDTLRVTIAQADSIFLAGNYQLLAADMNIRSQEALELQAKLYPNPTLSAEVHAYDFETKKPFQVSGSEGQKIVQLEQLIILGGKRKMEIELAKTNTSIARLAFQDIIRNLKYELHSSMYTLSQQSFLLQRYDSQLALLDTILKAYYVQSKKGNIPMKDVIRLKAVYLSLNNDRAELYHEYLTELSEVQIILQTNQVVAPIVTDDDLEKIIRLIPREDLYETALTNRPDYLIGEQDKLAAEQYYRLQKKMAIPDLSIYANYDQQNSHFKNQINTGISLPLPVWNRNKGNINSARQLINQSEYTREGLKVAILSDINRQYALYNRTIAEYRKAQSLYDENFDFTLRGMTDNFQKQNVSVLEFADFFESYMDSMEEIARIKIQLAVSAEQLNLITGKEVF